MFKNMNVLVTGATGFVGVNLVQRLLKIGANVTATLHKTAPLVKDDRIKYLRCDLQNTEDCNKVVQGIDFVFMCAAKTSGAAGMEKEPLAFLTPNVLMNLLMLEASFNARVKKFLFISSSTVYPLTDHPVQEGDVNYEFFEKYFVDAWVNRFSEVVCEIFSTKVKKPMSIVVVRPGNLYGEYDNFELETSHVIPALIRKVIERHDPIEIWGDGNDIKEFLYVQDFIDGILLAMEKITWFDPINIATGKPTNIRDVLNTIIREDNYSDVKLEFNLSKPTMIPKRMMDISKAKAQLEFEAKTSLEEGIRKTVAWYRQNRCN
jgi:GDP-L-fucose synthase